MKSSNNSKDANPDVDLRISEGKLTDMTRRISDSERLIHIYTLTAIIVCTVIVTFCRSFFFFSVSVSFSLFRVRFFSLISLKMFFHLLLLLQLAMRASRNLHNTMFQGVSRARMYFFHTNPSGRILNRFSKDMGQVDELLPTVADTFHNNNIQLHAD